MRACNLKQKQCLYKKNIPKKIIYLHGKRKRERELVSFLFFVTKNFILTQNVLFPFSKSCSILLLINTNLHVALDLT